jgi:hypothetical protein
VGHIKAPHRKQLAMLLTFTSFMHVTKKICGPKILFQFITILVLKFSDKLGCDLQLEVDDILF